MKESMRWRRRVRLAGSDQQAYIEQGNREWLAILKGVFEAVHMPIVCSPMDPAAPDGGLYVVSIRAITITLEHQQQALLRSC